MPTLKQFVQRMRKLGKDVEFNAGDSVRAAAIAVNQTVVLATPVDTGRARANWVIQLGAPPRAILDNEDKSGSSTIGANNSTIRTQKPGQTIYLSNNLDYIGALNEGSSSQAPRNFVETAVKQGIAAIRRRKLTRRR